MLPGSSPPSCEGVPLDLILEGILDENEAMDSELDDKTVLSDIKNEMPEDSILMECVADSSNDLRAPSPFGAMMSAATSSYVSSDNKGSPSSPDSPEPSSASNNSRLVSTTTSCGSGSLSDECESSRRVCLVCGDVASGFHYGVSSCEACKAFFKRTIQGNIEYNCPSSSNCEVNKRRRKACQACRYRKCLRMGMLREGVRLDRVRGGRQKYRRSDAMTLEDNRMLNTLTKCEPPSLLAKELKRNKDKSNWNEPNNKFGRSNSDELISTMAECFDKELVATIGWAKQIPGFSELSLVDQMRLLQSSWPEVLTLSMAFRSMPANRHRLALANDLHIDLEEARQCHLEEFFIHCERVVERVERVSLRREEYLLLKALLVANSDAGLEETAGLEKLRSSVLHSLHDCVAVMRSGSAALHVHNLLLLLPMIRESDQIVRRFWSQVHKEGRVHIKRLMLEMIG